MQTNQITYLLTAYSCTRVIIKITALFYNKTFLQDRIEAQCHDEFRNMCEGVKKFWVTLGEYCFASAFVLED